jgi:hypothetical protein
VEESLTSLSAGHDSLANAAAFKFDGRAVDFDAIEHPASNGRVVRADWERIARLFRGQQFFAENAIQFLFVRHETSPCKSANEWLVKTKKGEPKSMRSRNYALTPVRRDSFSLWITNVLLVAGVNPTVRLN